MFLLIIHELLRKICFSGIENHYHLYKHKRKKKKKLRYKTLNYIYIKNDKIKHMGKYTVHNHVKF